MILADTRKGNIYCYTQEEECSGNHKFPFKFNLSRKNYKSICMYYIYVKPIPCCVTTLKKCIKTHSKKIYYDRYIGIVVYINIVKKSIFQYKLYHNIDN